MPDCEQEMTTARSCSAAQAALHSDPQGPAAAEDELADVAICLLRLADELDVDLSAAVDRRPPGDPDPAAPPGGPRCVNDPPRPTPRLRSHS